MKCRRVIVGVVVLALVATVAAFFWPRERPACTRPCCRILDNATGQFVAAAGSGQAGPSPQYDRPHVQGQEYDWSAAKTTMLDTPLFRGWRGNRWRLQNHRMVAALWPSGRDMFGNLFICRSLFTPANPAQIYPMDDAGGWRILGGIHLGGPDKGRLGGHATYACCVPTLINSPPWKRRQRKRLGRDILTTTCVFVVRTALSRAADAPRLSQRPRALSRFSGSVHAFLRRRVRLSFLKAVRPDRDNQRRCGIRKQKRVCRPGSGMPHSRATGNHRIAYAHECTTSRRRHLPRQPL
jgi:hypothetical protein